MLHWKSEQTTRVLASVAIRDSSLTCCCHRSAASVPSGARTPRINADAPPDPLRGLSRPSPRPPAGRSGRGAGRAFVLPRLPPAVRRRRAAALRGSLQPHDRIRDLRKRRDLHAVRALPALDALLVAARVPA